MSLQIETFRCRLDEIFLAVWTCQISTICADSTFIPVCTVLFIIWWFDCHLCKLDSFALVSSYFLGIRFTFWLFDFFFAPFDWYMCKLNVFAYMPFDFFIVFFLLFWHYVNDLRFICCTRLILLRAQETPAKVILTLTSGLCITGARHVYNRDKLKTEVENLFFRQKWLTYNNVSITTVWNQHFYHVRSSNHILWHGLKCGFWKLKK